MGQQLTKVFDEAQSISLQAKMKLIMLTGITTAKAAELPDTPETLTKLKNALREVKAQLG